MAVRPQFRAAVLRTARNFTDRPAALPSESATRCALRERSRRRVRNPRDLSSSSQQILVRRLRLLEGPTGSLREAKWALLDSNQGPIGYEPTALTAELRALSGIQNTSGGRRAAGFFWGGGGDAP